METDFLKMKIYFLENNLFLKVCSCKMLLEYNYFLIGILPIFLKL